MRKRSAILAFLAFVPLTACANGEAPVTTGDEEVAASTYAVEVDLYSGRENPRVELDPQVGDQLYAELDNRSSELVVSLEPDTGLGFRGFVVTPSVSSQPVLRITEESVYAKDADEVSQLSDPAGDFYHLVFDDLSGRLPSEVLDALP